MIELIDIAGTIYDYSNIEPSYWHFGKSIKSNITKPVISYIAGKTAPAGKRMGHAGAIIAGGKGTAEDKIKKLKECGVHIADNLVSIGSKVDEILKS